MIPPLGKAMPAQGEAQRGALPQLQPASALQPMTLRFEERLSRAVDAAPATDAAALQALLGAALRLPTQPAAPPKSEAAPAPIGITPHDLAATVRSLQHQEPGLHGREAHWTLRIEDPLTPLCSLRISGDAVQGWRLQLTPASGSASRGLARHTARLVERLRSRGQPVRELQLGDDEEETPA